MLRILYNIQTININFHVIGKFSIVIRDTAHKLLCLQHEKLPLSAGGALEKVSL